MHSQIICHLIITSHCPLSERVRYNKFKEFKSRILVSTDIFGRGVDFERVNIVINYDMPKSSDKGGENNIAKAADTYLHRVGRSGRFGTKGLGITFVSSKDDSDTLAQVQSRFEVEITEMPETIDVSTYSKCWTLVFRLSFVLAFCVVWMRLNGVIPRAELTRFCVCVCSVLSKELFDKSKVSSDIVGTLLEVPCGRLLQGSISIYYAQIIRHCIGNI